MKDLTRMKICTETGTNMGKLKPVRCGCGGKAVAIGDADNNIYFVKCDKCWISTDLFHSKVEAIQAWNLAMGDFPKTIIQKIDSVTPVKCEYGDEKVIFASGYICPNCYTHVVQLDKYCHECGMKLDWCNYV